VSELASYSRPPVAEVALAVQFDPGTLTALDVATFRESIRNDFPKYEEQMARPPMEEVFDPVIGGPQFRVELLNAPAIPRIWFLNEDGSRLVQLQSDFLAVNWRLPPEGEGEYPRYETLLAELEQYLAMLNEILQHEGRSTIRPNWCEATYINVIPPAGSENSRPPLHEVLTVLSRHQGDFLPDPEDTVLRERFLIPSEDADQPRGRLTVEAAPGFRNVDRVPIWSLTFTSRLRALTDGDALEALNLGHQWAVRAFMELISPEMQSQWGLEKGDAPDTSS
jgi:uncharacterized protein (TIGR04255 family)